MSGFIIPTPAYKAIDGQSFGTQVEKQRLGFIALSLTEYDNNSVPQIAAGSCVEISGSIFQFPSNDTITGTPSSGNINYIMLTISGSGDSQEIEASWTTTAPNWNTSKQGWYDATGAKRYVGKCYFDGTNYTYKSVFGALHKTNLDDIADGYTYLKVTGVSTSHQVQTASIANLNVTEGKLAASAVVQAKLKTSMGEASNGGANTRELLPGGQYGFYPQTKTSNTGAVTFSAHMYELAAIQTTYGTYITLGTNGGAGAMYAQQRYVTSSGEIYWIFILRDKITKEIISVWQAPDHPCFGNGGKPQLMPHPFGDYDDTQHEIIVMNPTQEEVKIIKEKCIVDDELIPDRGFIDVILEDYQIDELSNPKWPDIPITVCLPSNWEDLPIGSSIEPVKKIIPQPTGIIIKSLKVKK